MALNDSAELNDTKSKTKVLHPAGMKIAEDLDLQYMDNGFQKPVMPVPKECRKHEMDHCRHGAEEWVIYRGLFIPYELGACTAQLRRKY